ALGLAFVVGAPGKNDAPKDKAPPIVGEWACSKLVGGGMELKDLDGIQLSHLRFEFLADGKVRMKKENDSIEGKYTIDAKKDPAELDLSMAEGGKEAKMIYKIDKDTLIICVTKKGDERPAKFESPADSKIMLMTFARVEKK